MKTLIIVLVFLFSLTAALASLPPNPYSVFATSGSANPSVTATNGKAGSLYLKTSSPTGVYQKQDNGTTTNWLVLATNGAAPTIPVANTIYVNKAGNDGTCQVANPVLPCLTVTGAMAKLTSSATPQAIVMNGPGTYSVDGMVFLANVFVEGLSPNTTLLDFGNSGITMDPVSWALAGPNVGGIENAGLISSGTSELTFDFSSFTSNNSFYLTNDSLPGNMDLDLIGNPSASSVLFYLNNIVQNKGNLNLTDAAMIVNNYANQNSGGNWTATGSNGASVFSTNSSYLGSINLAGNGSGYAVAVMANSVVFGNIIGTGNALMEGTLGTAVASSAIMFTPPAQYFQTGDAGLIPYTPANPPSWPGSPMNVEQALDQLASGQVDFATLNVVGITSLDNGSIMTDGLGDLSAGTFSSQISTNNTVGLTILADPVTQTADYVDVGQNGMGAGNLFRVDYLGDTTIAGVLQLPVQPLATTPTCNPTWDGALAITSTHRLCMCNGSTSTWNDANTGLVACTF